MPEVAQPQRLDEQAADLVGQITDLLIGKPFADFEKILPGVSGAVDLNAIKSTLKAEVARKIKEQISESTEESLLAAHARVQGLRTFLEKGGLVASSTMNMEETRALMGKNLIGPDAYMTAFNAKSVGEVPALPAGLTAELLNSRCPIANDGHTLKETHRLVFIPAAVDGHPFTLNSLRTLATEAAGDGRCPSFYREDWYDKEAFANAPVGEATWVLVPDRDLPGSRKKTDGRQLEELNKFPEYRTAKVLELVAPMVMNDFQNNGERIYPNYYGRCEERSASGARVYAGFFDADGLSVRSGGDGARGDSLGRALVRKLNT